MAAVYFSRVSRICCSSRSSPNSDEVRSAEADHMPAALTTLHRELVASGTWCLKTCRCIFSLDTLRAAVWTCDYRPPRDSLRDAVYQTAAAVRPPLSTNAGVLELQSALEKEFAGCRPREAPTLTLGQSALKEMGVKRTFREELEDIVEEEEEQGQDEGGEGEADLELRYPAHGDVFKPHLALGSWSLRDIRDKRVLTEYLPHRLDLAQGQEMSWLVRSAALMTARPGEAFSVQQEFSLVESRE